MDNVIKFGKKPVNRFQSDPTTKQTVPYGKAKSYIPLKVNYQSNDRHSADVQIYNHLKELINFAPLLKMGMGMTVHDYVSAYKSSICGLLNVELRNENSATMQSGIYTLSDLFAPIYMTSEELCKELLNKYPLIKSYRTGIDAYYGPQIELIFEEPSTSTDPFAVVVEPKTYTSDILSLEQSWTPDHLIGAKQLRFIYYARGTVNYKDSCAYYTVNISRYEDDSWIVTHVGNADIVDLFAPYEMFYNFYTLLHNVNWSTHSPMDAKRHRHLFIDFLIPLSIAISDNQSRYATLEIPLLSDILSTHLPDINDKTYLNTEEWFKLVFTEYPMGYKHNPHREGLTRYLNKSM